MTGTDGAHSLSENAAINTDDMPLLEFSAPFSLYASTSSQNNRLLQVNLGVPSVKGYDKRSNFTKDFFFRKVLNYKKLHIPIDRSWIMKLTPEMVNYIMVRDMALNYNYPQRTTSLNKAMDYALMKLNDGYEDIDLLFTAAEDLLREGSHDEAQIYLKRIEDSQQHIIKHSLFYSRAGDLLLKMNKPDEAHSYFSRSFDVNPYNFRSSIELGDSYVHLNKPDLACKYYKNARSLLNKDMQHKISNKIEQYCAGN
jgi:tetratricopeptide (TPR) repeat protein